MCRGSSDQEAVLQAQQYYEQKQYIHALKAYESVVYKGRALWYNMGNCACNAERYADALLYWLRAYKISSYQQRDAIKKNMMLLEGKLATAIDLTPFDTPLCNTSLFFLQLLFIVLWGLLLWSVVRAYKKKKYIWLFIITVACSIIGGIIFLRYQTSCVKCGLVCNETTLCAGPHHQYHILMTIQPAQFVTVIHHTQDWCKVKCGAVTGWLPYKDLVEI